jgi:hypothetical protein
VPDVAAAPFGDSVAGLFGGGFTSIAQYQDCLINPPPIAQAAKKCGSCHAFFRIGVSRDNTLMFMR